MVNCGDLIDKCQSITGEAPIHKSVLSSSIVDKQAALNTIVVDCNAELDTLDSNGWTALHHASYNGDLESAKILISQGASVDAFSNLKRTALHFAATKNHVDVIKLLKLHDASFESNDH